MRLRKTDRSKPKLGDGIAVFDVDVHWLRSLQAIKEKAEA
jgi:hypothetical protein